MENNKTNINDDAAQLITLICCAVNHIWWTVLGVMLRCMSYQSWFGFDIFSLFLFDYTFFLSFFFFRFSFCVFLFICYYMYIFFRNSLVCVCACVLAYKISDELDENFHLKFHSNVGKIEWAQAQMNDEPYTAPISSIWYIDMYVVCSAMHTMHTHIHKNDHNASKPPNTQQVCVRALFSISKYICACMKNPNIKNQK